MKVYKLVAVMPDGRRTSLVQQRSGDRWRYVEYKKGKRTYPKKNRGRLAAFSDENDAFLFPILHVRIRDASEVVEVWEAEAGATSCDFTKLWVKDKYCAFYWSELPTGTVLCNWIQLERCVATKTLQDIYEEGE